MMEFALSTEFLSAVNSGEELSSEQKERGFTLLVEQVNTVLSKAQQEQKALQEQGIAPPPPAENATPAAPQPDRFRYVGQEHNMFVIVLRV